MLVGNDLDWTTDIGLDWNTGEGDGGVDAKYSTASVASFKSSVKMQEDKLHRSEKAKCVAREQTVEAKNSFCN